MQILVNAYKKLCNELNDIYKRDIYKHLESSHRIAGIVGGRGVGKTTYLLHFLNKNYKDSTKALYVSADNIYFSSNTLLGLAEEFINEYAGEILCIDEIHRYPNWAQELKNIYDTYKHLKIIFSGSSSINLIKQKYDLSRRAGLRQLPGFSFREFLEYKLGNKLPLLQLKDLTNPHKQFSQIANIPKIMGYFKSYLKTGYYPMAFELEKEEDTYEAIISIVDKIINNDIASYYNLKTPSFPIFKKLLYFIHTSKPSSINIHRLANSLGKDHSDTANYINMLYESGLLRFLLIDKHGHALVRNADKVYLHNTNLINAFSYSTGKEADVGTIREVFVISNLIDAGYKTFYSKEGDVACEDHIFEIGGKSKSTKQIKKNKHSYLVKDNVLYKDLKSIPLYMFGFVY